MGFMGASNAMDPLQAELMAMKAGLQALVEKQCSRIIIETDSSQTANLMNGHPDFDHTCLDLILVCKDLNAKICNANVNYVPRVYNACADCRAKLGYAT